MMDNDRFEWVCKQRIKCSLKSTLFYLSGTADSRGLSEASVVDMAEALSLAIHQTKSNLKQLHLAGLIFIFLNESTQCNNYRLCQNKFIKDKNAPKKIVKI